MRHYFLRYGRTLQHTLSELRSKPWSYHGKNLGFKAMKVANFACAFHLFTEYIGRISFLEGPSMLPTLANEGEIIIEDRLTLWLNPANISRGDLITAKSPLDPDRLICKRVLGLPGDIICVDPTGEKAPSDEHVVIPKGHIWIIGDNAAYSRDSRDYGPVSMSLVQAKLYMRIWPIRDITIFRNPMTFLD